MAVHETAYISAGAKVHFSAVVEAFAYIAPGVTVGEKAHVLRRADVLEDVPPRWIVGGAPAEWRGCTCICGVVLPMHLYVTRQVDALSGRAFWQSPDFDAVVVCPACGHAESLRQLLDCNGGDEHGR